MAALAKRVELEHIVWRWERRDQIRRFALWLPRALSAGLIAFAITWLILRVVNMPLLTMIGGASLVGLIIAGAIIFMRLRARPLMRAVREFDQTLGLHERTSTALELLSGRIQTIDEIAGYQLDDAYRTAQQVNIQQAVPLVVKWRDWAAMFGLLLVCLLLIWGTQPSPVDALSPATRDAIANATDNVRDITESVANDTTLSAGERQTLLDTLETSLDALGKEPLSAEQAFASVSQVEDALQSQSNRLRSATKSENATYEAAAQALNPQSSDQSGDSGIQDFQKAMQQMQQQMNSGTSDTQAMQNAMEQASQMMQDSNSEMAKHLQDAADAMKQGDAAAAKDALNQAGQSAAQNQQAQDQREQTAQSLQNAAQNAGKAADKLAQSEQQSQSQQQGQQQQSQSGQQAQNSQQSQSQQGQQQQSQDGQQQQNQQGQPQQGQSQQNQQSQQGQQQQGQQQPGDSSQQGDPGKSQQGNNPNGDPQAGQQGNNGQSDAPPSDSGQGDPNGPKTNNPGSTGGGAGDQSGQPQTQTSGGGEVSQDNNPDGTGESKYEQIYAPQRLNVKGSSDIVLDPEASNQPVQEGDFQANPNGQSSVPYNQVFSQYSEAANQAIEGGYIPLSLRGVVQDYFTSIAPQK